MYFIRSLLRHLVGVSWEISHTPFLSSEVLVCPHFKGCVALHLTWHWDTHLLDVNVQKQGVRDHIMMAWFQVINITVQGKVYCWTSFLRRGKTVILGAPSQHVFWRLSVCIKPFSLRDLQTELLLSCQGNFMPVSGTSIQHRWNCEVTCHHSLPLMPSQPLLSHWKCKYKASCLCSFLALFSSNSSITVKSREYYKSACLGTLIITLLLIACLINSFNILTASNAAGRCVKCLLWVGAGGWHPCRWLIDVVNACPGFHFRNFRGKQDASLRRLGNLLFTEQHLRKLCKTTCSFAVRAFAMLFLLCYNGSSLGEVEATGNSVT